MVEHPGFLYLPRPIRFQQIIDVMAPVEIAEGCPDAAVRQVLSAACARTVAAMFERIEQRTDRREIIHQAAAGKRRQISATWRGWISDQLRPRELITAAQESRGPVGRANQRIVEERRMQPVVVVVAMVVSAGGSSRTGGSCPTGDGFAARSRSTAWAGCSGRARSASCPGGTG